MTALLAVAVVVVVPVACWLILRAYVRWCRRTQDSLMALAAAAGVAVDVTTDAEWRELDYALDPHAEPIRTAVELPSLSSAAMWAELDALEHRR